MLSPSVNPFQDLHTRSYSGHKKKVHSVAWNCAGSKLGSGSVDHTVRIWGIEGGASGSGKDASQGAAGHGLSGAGTAGRESARECCLLELRGHSDSVDNLCWDPLHADVLASVSQDKTAKLWDVRSGKCEQSVTLRGENINVTYKPDGTEICVGNSSDEITLIDVRKFKPLQTRRFNYEVNELSWDCSGSFLLVTTGTGCIEMLHYPSLSTMHTIQAHTAGVYSLAMHPHGRYFAVGSADAVVSLWDLTTLLCIRSFLKLEWPVRTLSFSHDGMYLASASEDLFIDIAEVHSGKSVHQIPSRSAMNSVQWSPGRHLLAFASDDDGKHGSYPGTFRVFGFPSP